MQSIWSESWKSSEFITTKIAFTSRSVAALQEKDLANRSPPMPSLITTLGGTIAAVCSRCPSQRNYEFAMDTERRHHVRVRLGRRAAAGGVVRTAINSLKHPRCYRESHLGKTSS